MLSLDEIGISVRNNIQLVIDNVGIPLAVGPISDDDYRILSGGFGELAWDYALSAYGNDPARYEFDPDPKSCAIQKQNSGMIHTSLNGGGADEKITIHRRADCLRPEAGRTGYAGTRGLP